jgi:hypothetical protein
MRRRRVSVAVLTFAIGLGPRAADADVAWIANQSDGTVSRIDLATHEASVGMRQFAPSGVTARRTLPDPPRTRRQAFSMKL